MIVTLMLLACLRQDPAACDWFPVRLPAGATWGMCTMHWQEAAAPWAEEHPGRTVVKGRCLLGPLRRGA